MRQERAGPEIEEKYGDDVKPAMHPLRLLYECKELLSEGTITLPRPEREFLTRVRTGTYSMDKIVAMAEKLLAECVAKSSSLPERADRAAISRLSTDSCRKAWNARQKVFPRNPLIFASGIMESES